MTEKGDVAEEFGTDENKSCHIDLCDTSVCGMQAGGYHTYYAAGLYGALP